MRNAIATAKKGSNQMKLKQIMVGFIGVTGIGYTTYRLIKGFEPKKYSTIWIMSLSDKDWEKEREIIRKQTENYDGDWKKAVRLEKRLYRFDEIMSDRQWGNEPEGFPKHSKHGWYLPSDD